MKEAWNKLKNMTSMDFLFYVIVIIALLISLLSLNYIKGEVNRLNEHWIEQLNESCFCQWDSIKPYTPTPINIPLLNTGGGMKEYDAQQNNSTDT